jgi:surfactin synthase thioesterase subunit
MLQQLGSSSGSVGVAYHRYSQVDKMTTSSIPIGFSPDLGTQSKPTFRRVDLFCLPFAGGSAGVFRRWERLAPPWLKIRSLELPGRGSRSSEPLPDLSLSDLAYDIASQIRSQVSSQSAVFGHSMGGLLAFEVTMQLELLLGLQFRKLFISGSRDPSALSKDRAISTLSDEALVGHLKELGGTPDEVFANPDLTEIVLPIVRADYAMCEQYQLQHRYRLMTPITVLSGEQDHFATKAEMLGWKLHTNSSFDSLSFPGGHFFLFEREAAVVEAIASELAV